MINDKYFVKNINIHSNHFKTKFRNLYLTKNPIFIDPTFH